MQVAQNQDLDLEMPEYRYFLDSLRSPATKKAYPIYLNKYYEFCNGDLLCKSDPRDIERKIIDFIITLKKGGLTFKALKNYVTAISSFYKINDVILNTRKINKFMPEQKRVKKDKAYEREQIQSLLDVADDRYRTIILLMASTGMRVGGIPDLKMRDLETLENDIYKVTVYEGSKEEYITFTTPECSKAIDNYFQRRQRYGEELKPDSPVIRDQFDVRDHLRISHPKKTNTPTIYRSMTLLSVNAGIRIPEKIEKGGSKRSASCRKDIAVNHGFRKFFSSQLYKSNVKTEARWLLEGHNLKGNDTSYIRTSEQDLLLEYMKAVDNLTINEENRLKQKIELLEGDSNEIQSLKKQVDENSATLNKFMELIELKFKNDFTIAGSDEYEEQKRKIKEMGKDLRKKGLDTAKYFSQ